MNDANDAAAYYYDIIYKDYIDESLTSKEVDLIKTLISKDGTVMDLGCGTGRHLIALAKEGIDVLGVDMSQRMLEVLTKKYPQARTLKANIYTDEIDGQFDLAIMMWNAIMEIAKDEDELGRLFQRLSSLLTKNGKILMVNLHDETKSPEDGLNFSFNVADEGVAYKVSWKVLDYDKASDITTCEEKIEMSGPDRTTAKEIKSNIQQKWWKKNELERISKECGFEFEELSLQGSKYRYFLFSK